MVFCLYFFSKVKQKWNRRKKDRKMNELKKMHHTKVGCAFLPIVFDDRAYGEVSALSIICHLQSFSCGLLRCERESTAKWTRLKCIETNSKKKVWVHFNEQHDQINAIEWAQAKQSSSTPKTIATVSVAWSFCIFVLIWEWKKESSHSAKTENNAIQQWNSPQDNMLQTQLCARSTHQRRTHTYNGSE